MEAKCEFHVQMPHTSKDSLTRHQTSFPRCHQHQSHHLRRYPYNTNRLTFYSALYSSLLSSYPSVSHPTNPYPPAFHQALEAKAEKALSAIEKEEKLKKQLDDQNAKLTRERDELLSALDEEKGSISDYHAKQQKLQAQKKQLEKQLQVRSRRQRSVESRAHLKAVEVMRRLKTVESCRLRQLGHRERLWRF